MEYYHQDHLGSTRLKTNSTGGAVYETNYVPFGPAHGESGSEEFKYTGKREDPSGLYYFGARYYDPETGRFITEDKVFGLLRDPQSQNQYTYCRNNPHKYIDPTGYWIETAVDVISCGLSAKDLYEDPNPGTLFWFLVDVGGLVLPLVPSIGSVRHIGKANKVLDAAKYADEAIQYGDAVIEGSYTMGKLVDEFIQYSDDVSELPRASRRHLEHSDELAEILGYTGSQWEKYGMWEGGSEAFFKDGVANLDSGVGYALFYDTKRGGLNMVYERGWMVAYRDRAYRTMYDISDDYVQYIERGRYKYLAGEPP